MNPRHATFALLAAAGLCLLGFARWPDRRPEAARSDEAPASPLLITSTIGAASAFLFVVDPVTRNLAAYEATPGEAGGLRLLGARKIEHDLELAKFRDRSEYTFEELGRLKGTADGTPETNAADKRDGS